MKALVTVLSPSAGTIRVFGFDSRKQGNEVRKRIGYLPQELAMYPSLSVFDFVNYMAELKGIHDKKAVGEVLEQVEMLEFSKRKIKQLSGGMKRRVGIAQALIGNPQILVVDEPTAGLDPEERVRFRGLLSRYAREGNRVKGKIKLLHLENENQLVELQKKSVVLQATYESHGLTARIMDEDSSFPGAVTDTATLEDAYMYCMGGKAHA